MNKDFLYKKYDDFEREENEVKRKILQFEVFNLLHEIETKDAEDYYLLGLTHYMSNDDKTYHKKLAIEQFQESLKIDCLHFLSRLYLAHCYHDFKNFELAALHYSKVDKQELKEFQYWRFVKLQEQLGECLYKLGDKERALMLFDFVLESYRDGKYDNEELPYPEEMLSALPLENPLASEMKAIVQ